MAASKQMTKDLIEKACISLTDFGEPAKPLQWMANYIITRHY
jgi:geranylgeranyl pyrophosphate synthase